VKTGGFGGFSTSDSKFVSSKRQTAVAGIQQVLYVSIGKPGRPHGLNLDVIAGHAFISYNVLNVSQFMQHICQFNGMMSAGCS
jgi:hypothetical protein